MKDTHTAADVGQLLSQLSAEEIVEQLKDLAAQEAALRTLLRAARSKERQRSRAAASPPSQRTRADR